MADRVFIFHETTDTFRSFAFDGTAHSSEDWSPGFDTIRGAAADATRIVVLDTSGTTAIARFFNAEQQRQSTQDITMGSNNAYSGLALTDTHLVAVNQTTRALEYYDLTTKLYDSSKTVTLPSLTSPEYYSGICRSGEFLYLITHNDSTFAPTFYKRNLDGSAVHNWAGTRQTTTATLFATDDHVIAVRKNGGHWDRYRFDGTLDTIINTIGAGVWAASYTTFDRTPLPMQGHPLPPQGLSVSFPSATTALLEWSHAADVATLETYQINYGEGTLLGATWKDTGRTRSRYLVKGLKRGTEHTFAVRGVNAAGAGAASRSVSGRTPIASPHNALFFKEFVHTGERVTVHGSPREIVRAVVDNDHNTFSAETDYAIDISRDTQPTRVDAVFIRSKGVTRHSGTPTGGSGTGWTNETLPETVENYEGTHISTTVLGFQHHLLLLDQHFTATSVRVRFQGTHVEIYEILLLAFLMEIDANGDFTEISPDYVDRAAVIHTSPDGGIRRSAPLGAEKSKWETNFVVKVVPGKTVLASVDEFVYLMSENPNFVFAQEFSRYPARVYPAAFLMTRVPTRLRGDNKNLGDVVQFRVGEQ